LLEATEGAQTEIDGLKTRMSSLETKVDQLINLFSEYLQDTKYKMPTFPPTAQPTRRRRSRAPTSA
jgi:hypothetical protein